MNKTMMMSAFSLLLSTQVSAVPYESPLFEDFETKTTTIRHTGWHHTAYDGFIYQLYLRNKNNDISTYKFKHKPIQSINHRLSFSQNDPIQINLDPSHGGFEYDYDCDEEQVVISVNYEKRGSFHDDSVIGFRCRQLKSYDPKVKNIQLVGEEIVRVYDGTWRGCPIDQFMTGMIFTQNAFDDLHIYAVKCRRLRIEGEID
ncbi:hypothetical protein [Algicola sagamiensis]|uniref:hypothetical protein n=1 Tax=Algicola sagamiensis TaxID=163869 RepID=UPI000372B12F|nr:hypothetical protein [Algicola sagamiensis]